MLEIDIISVQPQMFDGFLTESIVARAVKKGLCSVRVVDLKQWGIGRWKKTDDRPYGGGPGMLMRCEPWFAAVEATAGGEEAMKAAIAAGTLRIIMTSPKGRTFTQRDAKLLSSTLQLPTSTSSSQSQTSLCLCASAGSTSPSPSPHLIFLCGHYEGFDARIETLVTDFYSLGDFVMTGGELAAAAMTDAIVRLIPGALGGGPAATASESFGSDGLLEAPQYTHPPEFRGMKVPEVLMSGDHAKIERWRKAAAESETRHLRPDLT